MAIIGQFGGADDVRYRTNALLAKQAGALVPTGDPTINRFFPSAIAFPTITWVMDAENPGDYIFTCVAPAQGINAELTGDITFQWYSNAGASSAEAVLIADQTASTLKTVDLPTLVRPCAIMANALYHHANGSSTGVASPAIGLVAKPTVLMAKAATKKGVKA